MQEYSAQPALKYVSVIVRLSLVNIVDCRSPPYLDSPVVSVVLFSDGFPNPHPLDDDVLLFRRARVCKIEVLNIMQPSVRRT